jgi:hypothetical protein
MSASIGVPLEKYSEQELKYAPPLAQAILENTTFRKWIFSGTAYEDQAPHPVGDLQGSLRSPTMKNPYWFNYWCGKDSRCACRIGTGIETDILLVFDCASSQRVGLHIEIKRPRERLANGQAESYPRRAACWASPATRPKTVLEHDNFITMIACGREAIQDERLRYFDKILYHDDIAKLLPIYPEL